MFKARPVPKSLYERPSKKLQAQKLKSANKSIIGEESGEDRISGWSAKSQKSDQSFGIMQFANKEDQENISTNA